MDLPIQHYKENGSDEQLQQTLAMRTEWEPCLAHQSLQNFDAELGERAPPPPPPSKRRFRSPTARKLTPTDDRPSKQKDTLMGRQVNSPLSHSLPADWFSPCFDIVSR